MPREFLTGPLVRDWVTTRMQAAKMYGSAEYKYIDNDGKRAPEWDASRIHIVAFLVNMGDPLGPLTELLKAMPGCLDVQEIIEPGRSRLRPRVEATFSRWTED